MIRTARLSLACAIAAAGVLFFSWMGGPTAFGAHPFWSQSIAYIAVPAGLVVALLLRLLPLTRFGPLVGLAALSAIAFWAARWGKVDFAASYGEDQVAGQVWYFGWIAALAAATAALVILFAPRR